MNRFHLYSDRYDVVTFDQFGVLHDGVKALPGAVQCIEKLHALQKKMVVVSNSSSRKEATKRRYLKLGFPDFMSDFVTSGEIAHRHLRAQYGGQNKQALWCTWPDYEHDTYLADCGLHVAADVDAADVLVLHGSQRVARAEGTGGWCVELFHRGPSTFDEPLKRVGDTEGGYGEGRESLRAVFRRAAVRGLPAVCANPDFLAVRGDGSTAHMPGCLADLYDEECAAVARRGHEYGDCTDAAQGVGASRTLRFGKPSRDHFMEAIKTVQEEQSAAGSDGKPLKVLHVGDSLHHDVLGAVNADIDSLFIADYGVHKDVLLPVGATAGAHEHRGDLVHKVCDLASAESMPRPTFILSTLRW